jgi:hypothetical protein
MYPASALAMATAFSGDRTPTWTWTPKIWRRFAIHCISWIRRAYRGLGLTC